MAGVARPRGVVGSGIRNPTDRDVAPALVEPVEHLLGGHEVADRVLGDVAPLAFVDLAQPVADHHVEFPVLGQPAAATQPPDGALNNPSFGQDDEAFGLIGTRLSANRPATRRRTGG